MRVFYDVRQSVKTNNSFSPSAQKPALVMEAWKKSGVHLEVESFKPLGARQISLAHDSRYVRDVLACKVANGFGNKSRAVAKSLPYTNGSLVAATLYSLTSGKPSMSPSSGHHHASHSSSYGFCTFNALVIAAILARDAGAKLVGICDVDMHPGDGTADIIEHLGLDFIHTWSFGFQNIQRANSDEWLRSFPRTLFGFEGCDVLIVNAGVDSHVDDPLGGVLTTEQMRLRDHYIFSTAKALGIPTSTACAGGYMRDDSGGIKPTLDLHVNTLEECQDAFNR